ncbi:MAG TPA: hypothetical protein VGD60_06215 [Candidatus Acidoferrales bacterium]
MTDRRLQMRLITVVGAMLLVGYLLHSSMEQTQNKYEVCMTFKGMVHCATASGATSSDAIRSAQDIDCSMLANGRDETMVCVTTPPSSARQVK